MTNNFEFQQVLHEFSVIAKYYFNQPKTSLFVTKGLKIKVFLESLNFKSIQYL